MDVVTIAYYATVCGVLSLAGPRMSRAPVRFAVGIGIGVAAALLLPVIRSALGM